MASGDGDPNGLMQQRPDDVCTWCKGPRSEHGPIPHRAGYFYPPDWVACRSGRATAPDEFDPAPAFEPITLEAKPLTGPAVILPDGITLTPARGEGLGLGKDAPIVTNAAGGRQSHTPYRCDLFPPFAFLAVAEVLKHGADKYGERNWVQITTREHLNHAIGHVFAWLAGDNSDSHLSHAACRLMMAVEMERIGGGDANG